MKDYLKYPLSQEERDLITSIIWITAKSYKQRLYKRNRHQLIQFDVVDIPVEDEYDFFSLKTRGDFDFAKPIAMVDKVRIVEYVDSILLELSLYEFKEALTFDEKLVLLLYSFQKNTQEKIAFLLSVTDRTIRNRLRSIETKKRDFILGGLKNV